MIARRICVSSSPGARDPLYSTCVPPDAYQSLYYHRTNSGSANKSHWAVSRDDECHSFCKATDEDWTDLEGARWYVDANGAEVGTRQERVAIFAEPRNTTDPWHGYPVSARSGALMRRNVPREILEMWAAQGATKRELIAKLWKRAV
jgi:hypothetical protein